MTSSFAFKKKTPGPGVVDWFYDFSKTSPYQMPNPNTTALVSRVQSADGTVVSEYVFT